MIQNNPALIDAIRDRFAHVATCPFQGPRIFFENAGGALTLKSVVETSTFYASLPDNPGRINAVGQATQTVINKAKADLAILMNTSSGQFFAGESGTELLFRLIRTACVNAPQDGVVIGSSIEHPATRSAAQHWADIAGLAYRDVQHDNDTGLVTPEDYAALMTPDVTVATILHGSPVTGMAMDVAGISRAIRAVAPDCFIIVDGIQHAAHGQIDLDHYGVDGYAISPYKMFSRHGYGIAWISERFVTRPHEQLLGSPTAAWEFGTRDAGSYATISDVVAYFEWLGGAVAPEVEDRRARIEAAGQAIHEYEAFLIEAMINGTGNLPGLRDMDHVTIIAGADNPSREGLVSIAVDGVPSEVLVEELNQQGIRTHTRKADHYSGNVLTPLGLDDCIRVSLCHYNTLQEVTAFLGAIQEKGTARSV